MKFVSRRGFLRLSGMALAAAAVPGRLRASDDEPEFKLSLSERSLQQRLTAGQLDHLDFAEVARNEFEIDAIDYASRFFKGHVEDEAYLTEMNKRAADQGVRQVLLLVDGEGRLGAADAGQRQEAVRNHRRWIAAAQALGCRAVCVGAVGEGAPKEQAPRIVESLGQLTEYATEQKVNVLVANAPGAASNPGWLLEILKKVDSPRCAAFPLFGGFGGHDRYEGMARLMKAAKGVCATASAFNGEGGETGTDFFRMMKIVLDAGYRGYVSVEYRGESLDEFAGIHATKALLERVREATTG